MNFINTIIKSKNAILFIVLSLVASASLAQAPDDLVSIFPIDHYNQAIDTWLPPSAVDFDKPLLSTEMQTQRYNQFLDHYVGNISPWSETYINKLLQDIPPNTLKDIEQIIIKMFDNRLNKPESIGYGANFLPYDGKWIDAISDNINISQLDNLSYQSTNRAIATKNLFARALPTDDVFFNNPKTAGEGYPFDYIQMSAIWAGAPVYILAETRDHVWMLVVTPELVGWVKSSGIARVDDAFVNTWTAAAKTKLAAITQTKTSILNNDGKLLFSAYVGSVYPEVATTKSDEKSLLVPIMDENHNAKITTVSLSAQSATTAPMAITTRNISLIMSTLIGRTYGWGNSQFFNDCSAELKNLFATFGFWFPRNSAAQPSVGHTVDLSTQSTEDRINYLIKNGHRLLTLIRIPGHIMLYVGDYTNPNLPTTKMALTYQNMWGLHPTPATRRAIVGKAVFLPLLPSFPEDTTLTSQAGGKIFQLTFLDELPQQATTSTTTLIENNIISLRNLMLPSKD